MDETIEKKIIEESSDFSIFSLFLQADVVVKIVILLLLFSSVWSWTIIFSKYTRLKGIMMETEDFEEKFYSSETLSKLSKRIGGQPTHPMESVFFSAMVYFDRIKTGFSNKNFEFKKSFCENVKKEMEIVINKELSSLEKGLNFLASVALANWVNCGLLMPIEISPFIIAMVAGTALFLLTISSTSIAVVRF